MRGSWRISETILGMWWTFGILLIADFNVAPPGAPLLETDRTLAFAESMKHMSDGFFQIANPQALLNHDVLRAIEPTFRGKDGLTKQTMTEILHMVRRREGGRRVR